MRIEYKKRSNLDAVVIEKGRQLEAFDDIYWERITISRLFRRVNPRRSRKLTEKYSYPVFETHHTTRSIRQTARSTCTIRTYGTKDQGDLQQPGQGSKDLYEALYVPQSRLDIDFLDSLYTSQDHTTSKEDD